MDWDNLRFFLNWSALARWWRRPPLKPDHTTVARRIQGLKSRWTPHFARELVATASPKPGGTLLPRVEAMEAAFAV